MNLLFRLFLPLLSFFALIFVVSCNENLDYSTSPSDKLSFSADTVRFDTVFTKIGSSTRQFRIFNRSAKPLIIESVELMGASGEFSVVVDGQRGKKFTNVEIGAKDSLFVFVEVTVNPLNMNNAILISDSLVFRTNGNRQRVRLEAYGQDVIILNKFLRKKVGIKKDGRDSIVVNTIGADTTFTGERPFLVYDSLVVAKGAKLTLQPGVKLFFHQNGFCRIEGIISSKGTVEKPVVFRGDRMDNLFPDLPFDLYTGQWKGVSITADSYGNEMEQTQIRNGQYALRLDSSTIDHEKISLRNCKFTNVTGIVLSAFTCKLVAYGCEFSNGGADVVALLGGSYTFEQCSLVNNFIYPTTTYESPSALRLTNYKRTPDGAWDDKPLKQANFRNCIIYGRKYLEINFDNKPKGYEITSEFAYDFNSCLLKASGEDDTNPSLPIHFTNNIWDKDPKFLCVNKDDNYRFDFRLDSLSEAMDKANLAFVANSLIDMNGISRLIDGKPDVGAYERVKVKGK